MTNDFVKNNHSSTEAIVLEDQVSLALEDLRSTLDDLATWAKTPDVSDQLRTMNKAHYQLSLAMEMIKTHRRLDLDDHSWAQCRALVDEQFEDQ